jgi:PPOX class probable F420-dependent enzyme
MDLTPAARELLAGPNFAAIATINADGSLQQSVVWVRERDGEVIFSTIESRAKYRNLARDARISVLVIDAKNGYRYSEIRGTARLEPDEPRALIKELSLKYTGEPWVETVSSPRAIVVVTPEHITEHG